MKKKIMLSLLTCAVFTSIATAQNKVERYCKIYVVYKNKENIIIDYGKNENFSMFKDTTILNNLEKVKNLGNSIDALNYMNDIGWELLSIVTHTGLSPGERARDEFFFKKTFQK